MLERFGNGGLDISRFHDGAGIFRKKDWGFLRKEVEVFERSFPQVFFAFHADRYEAQPDLRARAFLLLNEARYVDLPEGRGRDCAIVCALDVSNRQMTLAVGYTMTPYLTEDQCFEVMARAHGLMLESAWAEVVKIVLKGLKKELKTGAKLVKKRPKAVLEPAGQELLTEEQLAQLEGEA